MPTETRRPPERRALTAPLVLAQLSTRLPPELLERLRVVAPQLDLRQSDFCPLSTSVTLARKRANRSQGAAGRRSSSLSHHASSGRRPDYGPHGLALLAAEVQSSTS